MNFQAIKTAIANTLESQATGAFQLISSARQSSTQDDLVALPQVSVFFHTLNFDKTAGTVRGKKRADVTYKLNLTVAVPAQADIASLGPTSTTGEVLQVLANLAASNDLADNAFDALVSTIWNILENPVNSTMGLSPGTITDLWIETVQKASPAPQGDVIVLSGTMDVTLRCLEQPVSANPVAGTGSATELKATIDSSADPLTVGFNPAITQDPKFNTPDIGVKVGT